MKRYERCPYCNIRATKRSWLKSIPNGEQMTFSQIEEAESNFEEEISEEEFIEFEPCGHTFAKSDVNLLDALYDEISTLKSNIARGGVSNVEKSRPIRQIEGLESRLRSTRWRVADKRLYKTQEDK